jgi:hypothetical protein
MTTPLARPVRRKTGQPYDHHGARLVVTLAPHPAGDLITIREARRRYAVTGTLAGVYVWLVARDVDRRRREKATAKRVRREARR